MLKNKVFGRAEGEVVRLSRSARRLRSQWITDTNAAYRREFWGWAYRQAIYYAKIYR